MHPRLPSAAAAGRLALLIALAWQAVPLSGGAMPITVNGLFDDWAGATQIGADVSGDGGSSGIDFGNVWAANDDDHLFLRFEIGVERNLQWGNGITLYVDTDDNASTGLPVAGMGAEIEVRFADLGATAHLPIGSFGVGWPTLGLRQAPAHSSDEFEIALDRNAEMFGFPLFPPSAQVRIALIDTSSGSQDMTPDLPPAMPYGFDFTPVPPPPLIPLERPPATDVRMMSLNVEFDGLFTRPESHARILAAVDPDIICFQELYGSSVESTRLRVTEILGGTWHAAGVGDCVTISRLPILSSDVIDQNVGTIIDLPDEMLRVDLCIINIHFPAGGNDEARREEIDHVNAWIRELRTPGGADLPAGAPIVILGDTNFISAVSQPDALMTGDIFDEATNGPDFSPDWDGGNLTRLLAHHSAARESYTWRSDASPFWPTFIDWCLFTDSVMSPVGRFIFSSDGMSDATLGAWGLERDDFANASDHRPLVIDFEFLPFGSQAGVTFH